jgi:hypothetical protein
VDELIRFPNGRYDDQVDAMTQFLDWLGRQDDIDFSNTNAPHFVIGAIASGYQPLAPCLSTRVVRSNGRGLAARARPKIHNLPFPQVQAWVTK